VQECSNNKIVIQQPIDYKKKYVSNRCVTQHDHTFEVSMLSKYYCIAYLYQATQIRLMSENYFAVKFIIVAMMFISTVIYKNLISMHLKFNLVGVKQESLRTD